MRQMRRRLGWLLFLLLAAGMVILPAAGADNPGQPVTILFTHDLHDHILPFPVEQDGTVSYIGGYARLASAIQVERQADPGLILLDAGDFSMGTLFQPLFASAAPGLRLLGQMGYDVVTLGNHEFDFRLAGLTDSLAAAQRSGDRLPVLVVANIAPAANNNGSSDPGSAIPGVQEYLVIERGGRRIGVFGLMGREAADMAPLAGVGFTDPVAAARRVVTALQAEEVDLIICLSHAGTKPAPAQSEDEELARQVPELDVIVSAHTHTRLTEPLRVGRTTIVSAGEYGESLGVLTLAPADAGWEPVRYRLQSIDAALPAAPDVQAAIGRFQEQVEAEYLAPLGLGFDAVLAETPFSFVPSAQIGVEHAEEPLGSLISDAYRYAVQQAEGEAYEPVDVAIVPSGTIRSSLVRGPITVADAFAVSPLGIGPDGRSGYPLISVYLTGQELRAVCEVDASVAPIMSAAQLYMSGLNYTFNPNRLIFNKVTAAALQRPDGSLEALDADRLYRVVAGLYSAQMLSVVGEKSFGLLSIVPKDAAGEPITDFETQVILDPATGNEIKEWAALAQYLRSFPPSEGVPQVPAQYRQPEGRKVVDINGSFTARFSQPNTIALAVYGIIVGLAALVGLGGRALVRRRKSRVAIRP